MTLQNNNFPSLELNRLAREEMKTKLLADTLRESIKDIQEARYKAYLTAPNLLPNPKDHAE